MYAAQPAMFRDNPIQFLAMVCLIPVFGLGLLLLAAWYIRVRCTLLEIGEGRVRYAEGVFAKQRVDIGVRAIRSVRINQTLAQRIFGTGDMLIYTAGDTAEITARGVVQPQKLKAMLNSGE